MKTRQLANLLVCAVLTAACGEDAGNDPVADTGNDAGMTDSDAGSESDMGPVDCAENEFEIDGECLRGGLDVRLLGTTDRFSSTSGFVSWAGETGAMVNTIEVTPTCVYGEYLSEGTTDPARPDCLSAGSITLSAGGETETVAAAGCYSSTFQMPREWGDGLVEVNLEGGPDFDATMLTLSIPEAPRFLNVGTETAEVVVDRINLEESDDPIIFILPEGDVGPMIQCTETSPGELRLSGEDVDAIQALEGQHEALLVIHVKSEYVVDPPYFFNIAAQNQSIIPDFLPPE